MKSNARKISTTAKVVQVRSTKISTTEKVVQVLVQDLPVDGCHIPVVTAARVSKDALVTEVVTIENVVVSEGEDVDHILRQIPVPSLASPSLMRFEVDSELGSEDMNPIGLMLDPRLSSSATGPLDCNAHRSPDNGEAMVWSPLDRLMELCSSLSPDNGKAMDGASVPASCTLLLAPLRPSS